MFLAKARSINLMLISIALSASACSRPVAFTPGTTSQAPEVPTPSASQSPLPTAALTTVPDSQPTTEIVLSATPVPGTDVAITAVMGNLYIRRGPGMAYNPIGVLNKGETLSILARDILSKWVQVPLPDQPGQFGWISIQTKYSAIQGDISSLPGVQVDFWPVAGYVINCSYHEMVLQPGDIIIPSLFTDPENEVWVYPGSYTVYDLALPDAPEVMNIEMREGLEVEILVNGLGEKHKCPED